MAASNGWSSSSSSPCSFVRPMSILLVTVLLGSVLSQITTVEATSKHMPHESAAVKKNAAYHAPHAKRTAVKKPTHKQRSSASEGLDKGAKPRIMSSLPPKNTTDDRSSEPTGFIALFNPNKMIGKIFIGLSSLLVVLSVLLVSIIIIACRNRSMRSKHHYTQLSLAKGEVTLNSVKQCADDDFKGPSKPERYSDLQKSKKRPRHESITSKKRSMRFKSASTKKNKREMMQMEENTESADEQMTLNREEEEYYKFNRSKQRSRKEFPRPKPRTQRRDVSPEVNGEFEMKPDTRQAMPLPLAAAGASPVPKQRPKLSTPIQERPDLDSPTTRPQLAAPGMLQQRTQPIDEDIAVLLMH